LTYGVDAVRQVAAGAGLVDVSVQIAVMLGIGTLFYLLDMDCSPTSRNWR
jgi:hypothetical protein